MGKKRVSKGETAFFASICSGGAAQRAAMGRRAAPALTKAHGWVAWPMPAWSRGCQGLYCADNLGLARFIDPLFERFCPYVRSF
jgi:hypothetical protein